MSKLAKVGKNMVKQRNTSPFDLFEQAFNDSFFRFPTSPFSLTKLEKSDWIPSVDVKEDKKGFSIQLDAPGFKKDDLKVKLNKNQLTIEGERKEELNEEENETKFHRIERKYGKFMRSFTLPENANFETLKAKYTDGVLEISLDKKEEQPKVDNVKIVNIE